MSNGTLLVSELSESNLPVEFLDTLESTCLTCGHPNGITATLSRLYCTNPNCLDYAVKRLSGMLNDLGVTGMTESKCEKFLRHFCDGENSYNPYLILMYDPNEDWELYSGCGMSFSQDIYRQVSAKRKMHLWNYIKIGHMDGIREHARKVCDGYSSVEDLFFDLDNGGVDFVQEQLGPGSGAIADTFNTGSVLEGVSVSALQIYDTLMRNREDIVSCADGVELLPLDVPVINVCISRSVGGTHTDKKSFIQAMNDKLKGKAYINVNTSLTEDCNFVIWAGKGDKTSAVIEAEKRNSSFDNESSSVITIVTGDEFGCYLDTLL